MSHFQKTILITFLILLLVFAVTQVQKYRDSNLKQKLHQLAANNSNYNHTKSANCQVYNDLPDPACTPGAIFASATKEVVCKFGYTKLVRNVTVATKKKIYSEYGINSHTKGEYEIDHFISLELGGSNDVSNLWPETANSDFGFHQKDEVENYLHVLVCNGDISLAEGQVLVSWQWREVYALIHQ